MHSRVWVWTAAAALWLLPVQADSSGPEPRALMLKLDGRLLQQEPAGGDSTSGRLLQFGRSDLQRRLLQSRRRIHLLEQDNSHVEREIAINEALIQRLQDLIDSRDQTASVARDVLRAREQATTVAALPAVPVKVVRLAPGALALNQALIPGIEDWMLLAALVAVIVLLLIWILRLRAGNHLALAAASRSQSLTAAPRAVAAPAPASTPRAPPRAAAAVAPAAGTADPAPAGKAPDPAKALSGSAQPLSDELKEIDTLIAFEQFNAAREKLQVLLDSEPKNPEFLVRHYHLCSIGDVDADDEDEALLRAIMDGPLSDTLLRVKAMGQSMMPGDPLFEDEASRDEALRVMNAAREAGADTAADAAPGFNSTVIMAPVAKAKPTDSDT